MRSPFVALLTIACASSVWGQAKENDQLAREATRILTLHCYRCHGQAGSAQGGFKEVLDFPTLGGKVVPGDPAKSRLFKRVGVNKDMPPEDVKERPSDAEMATLEKWIKVGAPALPPEIVIERPFLSLKDELAAMKAFLLEKTKAADRSHVRFFSLRYLHNLPQAKVRDADLRIYRAALSKLVNSLSRTDKIALPQLVDAAGTILALDVRRVDWDRRELWNEVLKLYPYGLRHDQYPDAEDTRALAKELAALTGTNLPSVRADWFIATAARPPLYHTLLQLPTNAKDLEKELEVKVIDNFVAGNLARAGFNTSGISSHNRMVERHEIEKYPGAYWKSYDFKSGAGRGNLFVFPLGPEFPGHPFSRNAFKHDGGEIIFNLPNGLQGYLLINGKDERINEGPIEVVSDGKKVSGTPLVVTGLSCMSCHAQGMIPTITDQIRTGQVQGGLPRDHVNKIYPKKPEMDALIELDRRRFVTALEAAAGPFLKVGADATKPIADFPEPIEAIARWYISQELTLQEAARELGLSDANVLKVAIAANPKLQELGLFPLTQGNTVKREVWEDVSFTYSPFQEVARELKLGTPVRHR